MTPWEIGLFAHEKSRRDAARDWRLAILVRAAIASLYDRRNKFPSLERFLGEDIPASDADAAEMKAEFERMKALGEKHLKSRKTNGQR